MFLRRLTAGERAAVEEPTPSGEALDTPDRDQAGGATVTRRLAAGAGSVLAFALVLFALVGPDQLNRLTPVAMVRIPVEGLIGVGLVLVLPARARRVLAVAAGVLLGLLTIIKIFDMGFFAAFDRPFDPLSDWSFLPPAVDYVRRTFGQVGAVGVVIGAVVLAAAVLGLMALAVLRLSTLAVRHRTGTSRGAAALGVVWITCALFGVQLMPGAPVASTSAAGLAYDQLRQVRADVQDRHAFAAQSAADAFGTVAPDQLLTALRGKDVIFTFVESYGRVAVQNSDIAPRIDSLLNAGTDQLRAAGFTAKSAFLTSSTAGGGSWLAHSTLQSGLWINNEQLYSDLVAGNRLTLTSFFRRAGWRTVGVVPANRDDWPEASFYGYNQIYDSRNIGYGGPTYSFASIPDQYTMSAFHRFELPTPNRVPVMAEIDLLSSHAPWEPVPQLVDWNSIGDGSHFTAEAGANDPTSVVFGKDVARVHADYADTIEYSLNTLISYVRTYGNDNLVLVFLGDHQPAPIVAGEGATRDVPVTIVAHDPAVMSRISGWSWQDGLLPDPNAPVWRMDTFRDRFLTAFSPQPGAAISPSPPAR
jgi:hypothetical protein